MKGSSETLEVWYEAKGVRSEKAICVLEILRFCFLLSFLPHSNMQQNDKWRLVILN